MKLCPKCHRRVIERKPNSSVEWLCPWMSCGRAGWDNGYGRRGVIPTEGRSEIRLKIEFPSVDIRELRRQKFSLIIAYAHSNDEGRKRGLMLLMKAIKSQTFKNYEIIVVEQVMDTNLNGYFPYKNEVNKHVAIRDPQNRSFNKSWVMNVGARLASTDNLIFHDADVIFGPDFLEKVLEAIPYHKMFKCWSNFVALRGRDNPHFRIHDHNSISALIGAWYCNKQYYFNVLGGYNESYFGYGREDNDIWTRASFLLGKDLPLIDYKVAHVYHHWHPADGANPHNANDNDGNKRITYTNHHPWSVIEILTKSAIGNVNSPYVIPMSYLK